MVFTLRPLAMWGSYSSKHGSGMEGASSKSLDSENALRWEDLLADDEIETKVKDVLATTPVFDTHTRLFLSRFLQKSRVGL